MILCGKGITTTLCVVAGRKETGIGDEDWKIDRWPGIDGCSPKHRSTNRPLINNKIDSVNGAHPTNLTLRFHHVYLFRSFLFITEDLTFSVGPYKMIASIFLSG